MAAYPTKLIFRNLGEQVESYMGSMIDGAYRFDGNPAAAIQARLGRFGAKGCLVFYGFDRREPTIFSASREEIHAEMPVEFIAVVRNVTRRSYEEDIEYLDDVMDRLGDDCFSWDNFDYWDKGIANMGDGPIRGLSLNEIGESLIGRGVRKTILRRPSI